MQKDVGLHSLNDPVNTTSAHGPLTFNIFASLAEFEREVIRERTAADLSGPGLDRGQLRNLSLEVERISCAVAALYHVTDRRATDRKDQKLTVQETWDKLPFRGRRCMGICDTGGGDRLVTTVFRQQTNRNDSLGR